MPRPLSRSEQVADLWVHRLAIVLGVIGSIVLIAVAVPRGNFALILSLLVYSCGLLVVLVCSALYNAGNASPRKDLLRRLDHAAIFVMIAGTYTPFLVKISDDWSGWLLIYVWFVAGVGATLKLVWINHFDRLSVILYLFLGWTILAALDALLAVVPAAAILLLVVGGILYTVGVIFHLWERLAYQQPIWHGFVIAAAACHYAAVFLGVACQAPGLSHLRIRELGEDLSEECVVPSGAFELAFH